MGGVRDLGLVNTYKPSAVDQDYADKQRALAEQRVMQNPLLNPTPEPPPEPPAEAPPEPPGRTAGGGTGQPGDAARGVAGDQPSMALAYLLSVKEQFIGGLKSLLEGIRQIPEAPGQGTRKAVMEGLLPPLASPLTAVFASLGQGLENHAPEVANAPLFDGTETESINRVLSGKFLEPLTPEEQAAFRQPMNVRQAIEAFGPLILPQVPKAVRGAKKVGMAAQMAHTESVEAMRKTVTGMGGAPAAAAFEAPPGGAPKKPGVGPQAGMTPQWPQGERAVLKGEPPVPVGMTRLYRAEMPNGKGPLDLGLPEELYGKPEGRFFSSDRGEVLDWVTASRGVASMRYVDLPTQAVETYRVRPGAHVVLVPLEQVGGTGQNVLKVESAGGIPQGQWGRAPKHTEDAVNRLNLDRIEGSDSLKATMSDLNKLAGERLEQHRARKGHDQQLAAAAKLKWTVEQMLSHEPEDILVDEPHAFRLRETARAAAEQYEALGKKAEAGDAEALAKLQDIEPIAIKLSALDEAQGRNLARGLEMRKEMATGALAAKTSTDSLLAMSRKMSESEPDPLLRFRRYQSLRADQKRGFLVTAYNALRFGRDAAHLAWLQALLSNPKTHMANLAATSLVIGGDIPETTVAGWINATFFRNPEGVQLAEGAIKLRALAEAQATGFRLMAKAWETGEQPFGRSQMSEHPRISAETYGFDPNTNFGRFIDVTGATLNAKGMPTRGLITEDAYMKGVAYDLELQALAYREALARGKRGKALGRETAMLYARPESWMIEQAQDHATLVTLNKELGPAGRAFISAMNAIPLGRVLFPFLQTPGNSGKQVFQRLPLLSLLSYQNWSDTLAGGALRDKALARVAVGHAMGTVFAYEVSQGHITGGGSPDKNLAALQRDPATSTKPPYSWCPSWSDSCYGFSRLDPLGAYMGAVADYVELSSKIPDQEAFDEWAAYGETIIVAGGKISLNKNYLQGASNVIDAIKDPNTQGGKLMNSYARTLVPAGLRELTRQSDDNFVREVNSIGDAIRSGLPWAASTVPVHRNWVTGEPITVPPGWAPWPVAFLGAISPVTVTKKNAHPVFQEIQKNEVSLPAPPRYVGPGPKPEDGPQLAAPSGPGAKVKLTDPEYDALITLQTETVKYQGRNLFQALEHLVATDKYKNASVGRGMGQSVLIRAEYQKYMETAMMRLGDPKTGSPNLRRDVRQAEETRYNAQHRPVTSPKSPQFGGVPTESLGR